MSGTHLSRRSVEQLLQGMDRGEFSGAELTEACVARVREADAALQAFVEVFDEPVAASSGGRLSGIPYATKANIAVVGRELTCCSRILKGYVSPFDATVTARLREAGATLLGVTNMDEFAMGSSTENSHGGPSRNPWHADAVPGGSSGGSAAAVAAGMVPFALGSDTGGSVRQPAAFCGVVGLKPTYGRVSRFGLVAFASSLDQVGPLTRNVRDAALVYSALAGHDPRDATTMDRPVGDVLAEIEGGPAGLRVGIPRALVSEGVDADVRADFEATCEQLRKAGAQLVDVDLPAAKAAVATYYVLCTAEASSNLARYDGIRYGHRAQAQDGAQEQSLVDMTCATRTEGFGAEVKRRIVLGTFVLSAEYAEAYYNKASQVRTLLRREFDAAFETCDVIATPTSPTPAFLRGEKAADPLAMYLGDVYTVSANLTGLPALSVPTACNEAGLPLAIHLTAPAMQEGILLRAGRAVEHVRGFDEDRWTLMEKSS